MSEALRTIGPLDSESNDKSPFESPGVAGWVVIGCMVHLDHNVSSDPFLTMSFEFDQGPWTKTRTRA